MTDDPRDRLYLGPRPEIYGCPICGHRMEVWTVPGAFSNEGSYILKCPDASCIFGRTKSTGWLESLIKKFNSRKPLTETCVAKECTNDRALHMHPLCKPCQDKYL